jgi:hypothetical protein
MSVPVKITKGTYKGRIQYVTSSKASEMVVAGTTVYVDSIFNPPKGIIKEN